MHYLHTVAGVLRVYLERRDSYTHRRDVCIEERQCRLPSKRLFTWGWSGRTAPSRQHRFHVRTFARCSLKKVLNWTQRILLADAVLMFGYIALALADGWTFQNGEGRRLDRLLMQRQAVRNSLQNAPGVLGTAVTGSLIGRIEIPRLGLSVIVAEGLDSTTLRSAAGHIPGTALPGQAGNIGISGHRDTFFRSLRDIRQHDLISLATVLGEYRYRVVSIIVTSRYDVAVLDAGGNEVLTLITCHPFYFVGSAPDRFVVRAERVGST